MANNRELSQLASFVSVNDTTDRVSFSSTVSAPELVSSGGINGTSINLSGVSTVGLITALDFERFEYRNW